MIIALSPDVSIPPLPILYQERRMSKDAIHATHVLSGLSLKERMTAQSVCNFESIISPRPHSSVLTRVFTASCPPQSRGSSLSVSPPPILTSQPGSAGTGGSHRGTPTFKTSRHFPTDTPGASPFSNSPSGRLFGSTVSLLPPFV